MCPGIGLEGSLRCFAQPSGGGVCRQQCAVPCLHSWLLKSGSWDFWSLYLWGQEFAPTVRVCNCFSSHTVSLHFVAQGAVCPGASIVMHCSTGSQVPACLMKLMVEGR